MQPLCLPAPNQEFDGAEAIATGWGSYRKDGLYHRSSYTLKYVRLTVTHNKLRARAMFGTEISGTHLTNPSVKDVCSGDSGVYTETATSIVSILQFFVSGGPLGVRTNNNLCLFIRKNTTIS